MADYSDFDDSIPSTPSFYEDGPFISSSPGDLEDMDWGSESPGNLSSQTVDTPDDDDDDDASSELELDVDMDLEPRQPSASSPSPSPSSSLPSSLPSPSPSLSSPSSSAALHEHSQHGPPGPQQRPGQRIIFSLATVAPERQPSLSSASRQTRHHPAATHDNTHNYSSNNTHNSHRGHHAHRSAAHAQEEQLRRLRTQRDVLLREIREDRAARRDRRRNNQAQPQPPPQSQDGPEIVLLDELFDMEVEQRPAASSRSVAAPPPRAQQPQQQTVIDLTDEPDSPVQRPQPLVLPRAPSFPQERSQGQGHRNPRRQMSQNRRTPSFVRSDGSILGANTDVIDLTADSPDDQSQEHGQPPHHGAIPSLRRRERERRSNGSRERAPNREISIFAQLHNLRRSFPAFDLPHIMAGLGRLNAQVDVDVQIIGQNNVAPPPNPLANNPVDFNYQANGFGGFGGRAPTPKPVFEPLPPPREGFTRESGPDVVVICPSCDEELKYNSEDKEDGPPTKKPRTRKDREEHHFWAVKACGHVSRSCHSCSSLEFCELAVLISSKVFCKKCYDNRKSSSLSSFRRETVSNSKQPKYLCAVDDCDSEVSQKTAWVGIFM